MKVLSKIGLALAMICAAPPSLAQEASMSERNKAYAIEFYNKVMNDKDVEGGIAMMGPTYTQHNPTIPDGKDGFRTFFNGFKVNFPKAHADIQKAFADGDYVALHTHFTLVPGTRGSSVVDIFRFEDGKLVEHWDVIQEVPEKAVHNNTMFYSPAPASH